MSVIAGILSLLLMQQVTLMWDPNAEPDVVGYHLYRASLDGQFARRTDSPVAETVWTDVEVTPLVQYRYVATAVNETGLESDYSNEVRWTHTLRGDANLSGSITVSDAVAIMRHIVGLTPLEGLALAAADANGDGNVTVSDVTAIHRHVAGIAPIEGIVTEVIQ